MQFLSSSFKSMAELTQVEIIEQQNQVMLYIYN